MRDRSGLLVLSLALLALGASCGETNRAALDALRPEFAARRASWAALASRLPQGGAPSMLNASLASLRLDEAHEENSSAELLLAEQLRSPDARLEESSSLDLGLSGALLRCVRWTGTSSPMSASALGAREGARLRRECGQALRMPWLVVLRSSLLVLPVASDGEHFTPGSARFDVLVYDAASGQLRASFVASAQTDERVQFTARTGGTTETVQRRYTRYGVSTSRTTRYVAPENPRERLEAAARSSLWTNAREAVARELRSAGAAVTLRSSEDLTP